jgi:hypothetical protein
VISLRKKHSHLLTEIGNANQAPVWSDILESTAVEYVGGKSVQVTMIIVCDQWCTVMLALITYSYKLPPFVI